MGEHILWGALLQRIFVGKRLKICLLSYVKICHDTPKLCLFLEITLLTWMLLDVYNIKITKKAKCNVIYNSKRFERSLIITGVSCNGKMKTSKQITGSNDFILSTWMGYVMLSSTGCSLCRRKVGVSTFRSKAGCSNSVLAFPKKAGPKAVKRWNWNCASSCCMLGFCTAINLGLWSPYFQGLDLIMQ